MSVAVQITLILVGGLVACMYFDYKKAKINKDNKDDKKDGK